MTERRPGPGRQGRGGDAVGPAGRTRPTIEPMPAVAAGCALPWDAPSGDPVRALADARRDLGDTFVVDSGGDRYLFTFSPVGVSSFYALEEERASKGVADWRMLRRKLPDEVFVGRRTLPHQLFGRDDVTRFLADVDRALDATLEELGDGGTTDVFRLTRRLGHRVGLASWGGPGAATGDRFEALATAFDTLDGSDAFVHPDAMAAVAASGKAAEVAALAAVAEEVGHSVDELPGHEHAHPLFTRLAGAWAGAPPDVAAAVWPTTSPSSTWRRCPTSSPHSGGPWSTSSSTRSRRPAWPRGTGWCPRPAPSSRSGWRSGRSCPGTSWSPSTWTWGTPSTGSHPV